MKLIKDKKQWFPQSEQIKITIIMTDNHDDNNIMIAIMMMMNYESPSLS